MSADIDGDGPRPLPSRRETIMSLVEMLLQHPGSGDLHPNQQPSFEDDKDVPSVDEHRQTVGAEQFNRFHSSVAILSSAFHLRGQIAQILFLYRENAADLFPRKISHAARETTVTPKSKGKRRTKNAKVSRAHYSAPPHISRPTIDENLDLEKFPDQFEALANNLVTFGRCLNEFPEFNDEAINASITSFEGDLKYWASCLRVYQSQFRYPAVQRYVHDLASEMGEHLDSITSTLVMFVEVGVPTIRFGQRHKTENLVSNNLLNLSTVATFFSAVTATTLQFSFNLTDTSTQVAVNSFWFASLVFSIAAAVNSLLGLTWKQAMYRSPGHRVPWWVLIWIKRSPLVFLVMSVACFSVGLCLFSYASHQSKVTSAITTIFTIFTSFGLAAVSTWFALERQTFLRHRGGKWLLDELLDTKEHFLALSGVEKTRQIWRGTKRRFRAFKKGLVRVSSKTVSLLSHSSDSEKSDLEANILPISNSHSREPSFAQLPNASEAGPVSSPASEVAASTPTQLLIAGAEPGTPPTPKPVPSKGRQLWKNAMQTVKMRSVAATPFGPRTPHRQRTTSSTLTTAMDRKRTVADEPIKAVLVRSRVTMLRPKLNSLVATEALEAHQALVRHLQFSPDGKFLATSSWDRTSIIWRVDKPSLSLHRVLAHAQGFVGQVAWSDTGNTLLTKLIRGVKVWTEDGVCQKTIDRETNVEAITWFPGSQALLSVEDNMVTKLDLRGNVLAQYDFGRMKLHDVAVTPDGTRLLGVGPLLESPTGLQPSKSPVEKRIAVYNTETLQIEHQTPVLNDVRDITLARNTKNGLMALVSYENKAPPQLWKMDLINRENTLIARLTLRHTYMPKHVVEFAGPSYFGGKNDELVLCAGKAGDIHIWDQESGTLLRHIRAQAQQSGDLTCIAWNHATEDPFMFATGSHDGAVRIWTKPEPDAVEAAEGVGDDGTGKSPLLMQRSSSPSEMDMDLDHTDSPLTQAEFEAVERLHESTSASEVSLATFQRERMVAFAPSSDEG
ncbi:quinon protein alcohol dehydrogenase-like superfamily [Mycena pura]|uniref:Quinon protein alcohol dehydrogenase-like superfamily n=1 Tax=Mycena pura TaxID=153505 RepID=A0AAD6V9K8_9AGAR|nr:quinon protein alcohol dehydrogenase-like superfamily [Mycena pura]